LIFKYKISEISLANLKYQLLADFEFYLKSQKKIGQNTASKYIKNIKKIVQECVRKKWLNEDPFTEFKIKKVDTDPTFLLDYELKAIELKELKIERLSQVRDMFVFSCYTGLSFIDVFKLTSNHVSIGIDGEKWIITGRQKNNIPSHIPLLPIPLKIIAKYKEHPVAVNKGKLLPMLSNQKMNGYLKEIADLCEIDKNLTYHVARHTFATTVTLTNGVPIESVSKMLGHKKIQTTQHYAKILDKKVSNDIQILRAKFEKKEQGPPIKKVN
jgi:site-specific recombinase XerD